MSAPDSAEGNTDTALYVYGVVAREDATRFDDVVGVDPSQPIVLLEAAARAAITSAVRLAEFGDETLEANLRDPTWLEDRVRAHDRVLAHAAAQTTVVPFRFATIYRSADHVLEMLRARSELTEMLERLSGKLELGVKAFLSRTAVRDALAGTHGLTADEPPSGRAYMLRRSIERDLDEAVQRVAATRADEWHERLSGAAEDARANPVRPQEGGADEQMFLNGAYLVRAEREADFRAVVETLPAPDVRCELTGPWPPYNFAELPEARE